MISNTILEIAKLPIYMASLLIPKRQDLVVFGSWFGKQYGDNTRYVYEFALKNNKSQAKIVWIYKDHKLAFAIPGSSLWAYSLEGIWVQLRAKVAVVCQSKDDLFRPCIGPATQVVQLWHGFPIKKIALDARRPHNNKLTEQLANYKNRLKYTLLPFLKDKYHLLIALSAFDKRIFSGAFNIKAEKVKITGYPRNDAIKSVERQTKKLRILYAPTFRGQPGTTFDLFKQFGLSTSKLERALADNNTEIDIRFHPMHPQKQEDIELLSAIGGVRLIVGQWDVYQHLSSYHVLMTDYSSLYVDYQLTKGHIILAQFDIEKYKSTSRDSYIDFGSLDCDARTKNWDEVCSALYKIRNSDPVFALTSHESRCAIKRFHTYFDGRSSQRVWAEIESLLKYNE